MIGYLRAIWEWYPFRRRRFWRYVSPRRRGVGIALLLLVTLLTYGYWSLTNDASVRFLAEHYLQSTLGGRVEIRGARFRLFEGIQLNGVTIYLPVSPTSQPSQPADAVKTESPDPFFTAQQISLRYRPWSLLRGKLEPTNLDCQVATVTLDENNIQQLTQMMKSSGPQGEDPVVLPSCTLRQCTFRIVRSEGGRRESKEKQIDMSMTPQGADSCRLIFEEPREGGTAAIQGSCTYNFRTGEKSIVGTMPIEDTFLALPKEYRAWLDLLAVRGSLEFKGKASDISNSTWTIKLVDAGMTLPVWMGGLNLDRVNGEFDLQKSGVTVRRLRGQLPQAGGAWFEINGAYGGFAPDSPFDVELKTRGLVVPAPEQFGGILAQTLRDFRKKCRIEGTADVAMKLTRQKDKPVEFSGLANAKDLSVFAPEFPYKIEHAQGMIRFDATKVVFGNLEDPKKPVPVTGMHGSTKLSLWGQAEFAGKGMYDLHVQARELTLNDDVDAAFPKQSKWIWKMLSPKGVADVEGRLWCTPQEPRDNMDITITADGRAGVTYGRFPYPVEGITGQVHIKDSDVILDSMTARQGPMRCRINGAVRDVNSPDYTVEMTIVADDLPLDDKLTHAIGRLGTEGAKWMGWMRPEGRVKLLTAGIRQPAGKHTEFAVQAQLEDVAFTPIQCPYRLEKAAGNLTITQDRITIGNLSGRHGSASIVVGGQVELGSKEAGIDLRVTSPLVSLDEELYKAMPPRIARVWKQLSPSGSAGVDVRITQDARSGDLGYRAEIHPKDMRLTFREFPYPFQGVCGTVVATPGLVDIPEMKASWGKTEAKVSGKIVTDEKTDRITLAVEAVNLPLDETLMKAMPEEMASLRSQVKPGGTVDAKFRKLQIVRIERPSATSGATGPASAPDLDVTWSVDGSMGFHDVAFNIGQDEKKLTGAISGKASRTPEGLEIQAKADIQKLQVGPRVITEVGGEIVKLAASQVIHVRNFSGKAYGGMIIGAAQIKLADPVEYSVRLDVEGLDLLGLINAGAGPNDKKLDLGGKVSGRVQYSFKPGAEQQAAGQLWVTQARIVKLPVMLDLLHVLVFSLPGERAFSEGSLTYSLKGDKLVLSEIHFTGTGLSILGSGTVDLATEKLNLTFLTGSDRLPRMGPLSDLLKVLSQQLSEIHVTGTIQKPKTQTVPLHSLQDALETLLNPGKKTD